jgi:hypothetical protein
VRRATSPKRLFFGPLLPPLLQTGEQHARLAAAEFLCDEVSPVPRRRRERRARTHDWQAIQQQTLWPEQEAYERLRPKSRPLTPHTASHLVVYIGAHTHKEEEIFVFCSVAYLCPK